MAIGGFFAEMLAEGLIFRWLASVWGALKGGISHPVVQDWAKTKLTPKGLDDESIFTYLLSMAKFTGTVTKKKLIKLLNKLEIADKANGTKYVRNFRLIVAIDAIGRGTVKVEKKDKDGKVVSIEHVRDKDYDRPGKSILENLAAECKSNAEMTQYIMVTGAMQDAPFGTLDEMFHWAKKTAWPWISAQWNGLRSGVMSVCQTGESYYQGLEARMDAFDRQPFWRKIIDPRNWFGKF